MNIAPFSGNSNMLYGVDMGNPLGGVMQSTDLATKGGESLFGGLGESLGGLGNVASIVGSIGSIFSSIGGITQGRKALKQQQQAIDMMKNQYAIENQRYNERMQKHDAAAKAINDSADYFERS